MVIVKLNQFNKKNNYNINYKTLVTGTHLSNELGSSIDDLKKIKLKLIIN